MKRMNRKLKSFTAFIFALYASTASFAQLQSCPANVNFVNGDLSFWSVKTGLIGGASQNYPLPNTGLSVVPEYTIGNTGIKVITSSYNDFYGGYQTIPTINGYAYNYSVQLGSTSTSWDLRGNLPNPGGFARSISYSINVPAGPTSVPYTMTYAYAMVLENGTHNNINQPLFKATLQTANGNIISCASPEYFLPTLNDAGGNGGTGATLDTAAALANGFTLSPQLFLSHSGTGNGAGTWLQDVWTKGWREVTFDLSPYRGTQVTLTFESHNCAPGAHFAYAYIALRNTCGGLKMSGAPVACTGTTATYSVPALADAVYTWTVPPGWVINSGANTNVINVTAGPTGGVITVREVNSCADLRDTFPVSVVPPTLPGQINSDNTVCTGTNSTSLSLTGERGNVLGWISSTNGINWNAIANTTNNYTAANLIATTQFAALVQNGASCKIDTSRVATITVNPKSVGGILSPASIDYCLGEIVSKSISLNAYVGNVVNWQISSDNINWNNVVPANTTPNYLVQSAANAGYYRTVVKSGVCPADTSTVAKVNFINVPFPVASIYPATASICYGKTTPFNALISIGTNYTWSNAATLSNQGNGIISSLPLNINATAAPKRNTDYVLSVTNAGCPNILTDTFRVIVAPKINVFAGNDTFIVAGQPLQLNATANDPRANVFNWTPFFGLSDANIYNPIALLGSETETIRYIVRATNPEGCYGEDDIKITVFKTGPDIFVPTGFTPNGDGLNDVLKPIYVGIKQLNFFRVFNRWGQMVFSTSNMGAGWDGRIGGVMQSTATFVFMAEGIDYTGKRIFKKGTTTLIL